MQTAAPSLKAALLHVLAQRKEPEAAGAMEAATKDPSAEVRVTAFQLLGRLEDPALEETLLEAATDGSDAVHPVALEAYLRLAEGRLGRNEKDAALAMVLRALDLARTDPLRRMALRGLAQVASPKALPQVEPLLTDEAVRDDALRAYVAVAGAVADAGEKERGIEMLRKALELGPPRDVTQALVTKLRDLGVHIDPARSAGFVSTWWLLGPFSNTDVDQTFPPEQAVDLQGTVQVDDKDLPWVKHQVADIMGVVNLLPLMQPNQNVTAYLYAEVRVEAAQDVLFKMGSDDGMKCWLNGQLIHRYPQPRSLTVDQDTVPARLNAGVNKILLKVVNLGGGWECCLRITAPDGKPIAFDQPER
jgi:tetratricopeptide (TPR) repeat protein